MQLKNFVLAASAAATAAALPSASSSSAIPSSAVPSTAPSASASAAPLGQKPFNVLSIHSGDAVQYAAWNAAKGSLFAGLKSQNASCARPQEQSATFYIQDGALFLYKTDFPTQEFYVDRSGMGQGKIGYTTGAQPTPRNSERQGWAIDANNHLQFAGKNLIACPNSIDGAYSIWASAGTNTPGYNKGCVGIAARVEQAKNPNACQYTQ
ncbi:hypothetical protein ASPWEDRAFT_45238 [Aspergillus wentii DTO 134E9]|uniref:Cell wall protein PhiA n=1 Tax=Aspergillus wentii DTO 134E9 TaxID=1073089 RepID=A0A1L9R8N3_ASPWE|nr:uncharacterized protein ASPWEDRAFT_45238 [Aspergillus wentii DTO 134E9]OJJ31282.1 hypothetical protein ASPWEDRAFT_45238 [Aspergillus wentii DTO 134E9]